MDGRGGDTPAVSMRDAGVRVGGRLVWHHVDIDVASGSFTAVLGPNGVGKSTLVKALLGLVPLAEGRLRVLGRPVGEANRDIGYLPQRRTFDSSLRIRGVDVVRLGLDGHRYGLPMPWGQAARTARERVGQVIADVGASDYAHRPIGQLSGGEQQRLLVAQALVRRPRLLLLDEPLDSLDLPNQAAVAAMIRHVSAAYGVAVVMVAHDVNPILPHLDQVIYFGGGTALSGPPEDVITTETLSALYATPVEVLRASDGRLVVVGQPEAPATHTTRHPETP